MKFGYQNGKIRKMGDIKISPYDLGFLRGYAVFDVMRTTKKGKIFLLDEHYQRIKKSAKQIGLKFNLSKKEFENTIYKLMKRNQVKKVTIRTVVTGGIGKDGIIFLGRENIMIFLEKFAFPKKENLEKGIKIITHNFKREIPKIKTTNYLEIISQQKRKQKAQAYEVLYIKDKKVFETSTSNIFIIKNNKIFTPKNGILLGTTRNLVVRLLKKNLPVGQAGKIKISEQEITEKMLNSADEVFLTATSKNVLPVRKIDNKLVGDGKVGPLTKKIQQIFNEFEKKY